MLSQKELAEVSPCGVLLSALERARSRFAIAVATEKKATPPEKYRHYLQTEDRVRGIVRELRSQMSSAMTWHQAIDALRKIPDFLESSSVYVEADILCAELWDIMAALAHLNRR